jgi:putative transposase
VSRYRFIAREAPHHPVALSWRLLRVARTGYYAWRRGRPPSARARADAEVTEAIHRLHRQSRGTYGSPRLHADLRTELALAALEMALGARRRRGWSITL